MKCENETTEHNRTIHFTEIPAPDKGDLTEMLVIVNYPRTERQAMLHGITLDSYVIPAVIRAVNAHDELLDVAKDFAEFCRVLLEEHGCPPADTLRRFRAAAQATIAKAQGMTA